jgi:4-hydroxybenzoate polyprenyltransferase
MKAFLELVRAPAALSVPGDVIAGAVAAGVPVRRTAGLAAASVCLYWAGMAANDWADRDIDAVERPHRPVPSGRVSPGAAFGVAAGLTAAGVTLAGVAGGRRALAVAVPLAVTVWGYDLGAKNTAAGPLAMAACRALDVLLGASTGRPARALPAALTVGVHTYTVTALSRHEVAAPAPVPTRERRVRSVARRTLVTTATVAGAVAAGAVTRTRPRGRSPVPGGRSAVPRGRSVVPRGRSSVLPGRSALVAVALAAGYAARYGRAQVDVLGDPAAPRVRTAVGTGIVTLPALQGALTARAGAPWAGLAVALAAPLGRALARAVSPT